MPRHIVKIADRGVDYFVEWSTVVDAPVTHGMTFEEIALYYLNRYGTSGMDDFDERIARTKAHGTSCRDKTTAEELIAGNRAGPDERELTMAEIIEECIRKPRAAEVEANET